MIGSIVRILLLCLVVGLVLAFFNIHPATFLGDIRGSLRSAFIDLAEFFRWAKPYVMLGALIVVPIAVIMILLRLVRR